MTPLTEQYIDLPGDVAIVSALERTSQYRKIDIAEEDQENPLLLLFMACFSLPACPSR